VGCLSHSLDAESTTHRPQWDLQHTSGKQEEVCFLQTSSKVQRANREERGSALEGAGDNAGHGIEKVPFFIYDPDIVEPRFQTGMNGCTRKGADYMFVEALMKHPMRQKRPEEAEIMVIPCLFESYRRCTTTNHAEKPPGTSLLREGGDFWLRKPGYPEDWPHRPRQLLRQESNFWLSNPEDHPEDFEDIPWMKALDDQTAKCLDLVMSSKAYKSTNGRDHLWVVGDWTMNFGRTLESHLFQNMTVGRIEVIDEIEGRVGNKWMGPTQSRCSVVVPYASDVAYLENFALQTTFEDWMARPHTASFRFEDREYVLYCQSKICPGAVDATPLRKQSLLLGEKLGMRSAIAMGRVEITEYLAEIHGAKFCLVIRGDTPSSHGFFDALAANCIPVLISDRWPDVAVPFAHGRKNIVEGGIDFTAFTVRISEETWMNHMDEVVGKLNSIISTPLVARQLFEAMQEARPKLLWSMPHTVAPDLLLQSANLCTYTD